jgi:uncharacterized protein (TIGR03437 family)
MNIINASTPLGSVNFTETSLNAVDIFGNQSDPIILLLTPSANDNFRVSIGAGETVANAVTAQISTPANPSVLFLQGVGIVIRTPFDNNLAVQAAPPANCVGSTLSDQFGIAKCTVKANCQIGVFPVRYTVGFQRDFFGTINVTKGTASLLTILNGNNQTGRAGDTLPIALSASVSDKCANIVGGVPVTWSVVSGSATLVNTISVSSNNGSVSTQVKLGQTPGQVKISVAIGNLTQVIFTLTNQVVVASLTLTGGNNQTTVTGQTFPQPLTFTVKDVSGNPVPGIVVNFAVVSGSAGVNPTSATTNAQGNASTTVTAGVPAGAIVISGSYSTFSASATLTSRSPGPGVTTSGFVNAASFQPGLSPCGLATVIGTGIATGIQGTVLGLNLFGGYSSSLNGLSLSINGVTGPIYSLSNSNGKEQATFQVPCETAPGFATVVVTFNGGSTTVSNVPVVQAQPGIFTFVDINGTTYADVISAADGSYVSINNPARKGGSYFMFVTGLGLVSPATATNRAGIPGQNVNVQLTVGVGTGGAALNSAQYATGFIGIYLVGFTIPTDAQSGDRNLSLGAVVNGTTVFSNSTLIRIQ